MRPSLDLSSSTLRAHDLHAHDLEFPQNTGFLSPISSPRFTESLLSPTSLRNSLESLPSLPSPPSERTKERKRSRIPQPAKVAKSFLRWDEGGDDVICGPDQYYFANMHGRGCTYQNVDSRRFGCGAHEVWGTPAPPGCFGTDEFATEPENLYDGVFTPPVSSPSYQYPSLPYSPASRPKYGSIYPPDKPIVSTYTNTYDGTYDGYCPVLEYNTQTRFGTPAPVPSATTKTPVLSSTPSATVKAPVSSATTKAPVPSAKEPTSPVPTEEAPVPVTTPTPAPTTKVPGPVPSIRRGRGRGGRGGMDGRYIGREESKAFDGKFSGRSGRGRLNSRGNNKTSWIHPIESGYVYGPSVEITPDEIRSLKTVL